MEILSFGVGNERYGLEQAGVRRVLSNPTITRLPLSAGALVGVVAVEDVLLPVFDLAQLFGLAPAGSSECQVLILGFREIEIGLLVAEPHDIARVRDDSLARVPWPLAPANAALILGVATDGTVVLDTAALLEDDRLFLDPFGETGERHPVVSTRA